MTSISSLLTRPRPPSAGLPPWLTSASDSSKHKVNQIKTQTVRDRVMATLDADPELAGKWRLVNETPEFIAWRQEPDPLIGQPKLDKYLARRLRCRQRAACRGVFPGLVAPPHIRRGARRCSGAV